jgi:hypothetical protein
MTSEHGDRYGDLIGQFQRKVNALLIRAEIDRLVATRETIITRADAAVKVTRAVLQDFSA